jgi:hypothetical protein
MKYEIKALEKNRGPINAVESLKIITMMMMMITINILRVQGYKQVNISSTAVRRRIVKQIMLYAYNFIIL